jgi:hypothetical protein
MLVLLGPACGKRGAPLPPLNLVPEPPSTLIGKRVSATVYLQMAAPRRNANGPGTVAIDHLEVYAVTVQPGLMIPANRDLFTTPYLVGQIAVKPPPDDDEGPVDQDEEDTRPGPGEPVTFSEVLTEKQLQPSPGLKPMPPAPPPSAAPPASGTTPSAAPPASGTTPPAAPPATGTMATPASAPPTATPPPPAAPPAGAPATEAPTATSPPPTPTSMAPTDPAPSLSAAGQAAAGQPPAPPPGAPAAAARAAVAPPTSVTQPVRIYVIRGVTRKGRPGPPSTRVMIPLVPPPPPPSPPSVSFTEHAVSLKWLAPVPEAGTAEAMTFNVYAIPAAGKTPAPATASAAAAAATPTPLNAAPLAEASFEHPGAAPGVEQCFAVRTVERVSDINVESEPTPPVCVTPRDIFAPAAPKGLAVVAMDGGVMNLIWDASPEADLGGYLVLRGEAPGDTLQPLTPEPIHETSFRDTTVKPGVRYVYAIVAVDRATPPNRSEASARVEETAR